MNKSYRQGQNLKTIRSKRICTQDELARELGGLGIQTTQVTLSRDMRELRLVKTAEGYRQLSTEPGGPELETVANEYLQDIRVAQNLVVLRTSPGNANTLAVSIMAPIARMGRAGMLETLASDYVQAAWAAGLPAWRIVYGDAMRNAMIPVITTLGAVFGFLMAGNAVIESVFAWPGIGNYAVTALMMKDSGPIQSFVLFVAVMYVLVNLAVDIAYGLADPRIRLA